MIKRYYFAAFKTKNDAPKKIHGQINFNTKSFFPLNPQYVMDETQKTFERRFNLEPDSTVMIAFNRV